ncbi:MAG: benzoylformate decarboxylase [Leucobacter sp.]
MKQPDVLQSTARLLRDRGLTVVFGNPGSNELPFLAGLGDDFDFVLGLHEQAVVGMAEGYSRATGGPVLVNLHAASGTGNAMGALTNAHYGNVPLVILAGQQVRETVGQESMLANIDAGMLTRPLTKFSHEPLSACDVPRALSQAIFEAVTEPRGPVYLSVPLDDWAQPARADDALLLQRSVRSAGELPAPLAEELAEELDGAARPALVLGPQVDAASARDPEVWSALIRLAERTDASVYVAPSPPRGVFPTAHPNFCGVLVPGIRSVHDRLVEHDAALVIGAPVFRYHRWEPGSYLPEGTALWQITQDPSEAARAPFGRAVVGDVGAAVCALADRVRDRGSRRPARSLPPARTSERGMTGTEILEVLNAQVREDVVYVNETTTLDLDYLERIDISQPNRYHFPASGGLGFGLPAAVGFALGQPEATVVATVGDGSANYGITALYTAAQRRTRTVFVIVNNSGYGALAGFAARMGVPDVPGLGLGGIDFVKIAEGYGVPASLVSSRDDFDRAYRDALLAEGPVLIEARVVDA